MKKILLSLLLCFTGTALGQDVVVDFSHVTHTQVYRYAISVQEAAAMEAELRPIIHEFMMKLNMMAPRVRWTVYVLDELGQNTPALVTYWSSGQQWVVVFNFRFADLTALTTVGRRVLIGHEVGHLTGKCLMLQSLELQEICADVISADLTSPAQVLSLLRYFRPQFPTNEILTERIAVMENLIELTLLRESVEKEPVGPTLEKENDEEVH